MKQYEAVQCIRYGGKMFTKVKRKGYICFSLVGILFFLFVQCCKELTDKGNIIWNGSWIGQLLIKSILGGVLLGCVLFGVIAALDAWMMKSSTMESKWNRLRMPKRVFFFTWVSMMICWLPGWLAYFPGICSYDTTIQMGQIVGKTYNTHHPLAHTLLMGLFVDLGKVLGSASLGMGIYTFVQMCCLAAAFSAGIALLARQGVRTMGLALITVYCVAFPPNWYMAITSIKDTFFSIFVLLFLMGTYVILNASVEIGKGFHLCYILCMIAVVIFRNNGKYALMAMWVLLGITCMVGRKKCGRGMKRLFLDVTIGLVIGCILMSGLTKVLKAQEGDKREMLSMPIQQMARTMLYHGGVQMLKEDDGTMEEIDRALIQQFLTNESYKAYRPDISDPVKSHTNTSVVRYQPINFAKSYLRLLISYPGDFINAELAVNAGYFSPWDISHATINYNNRDIGLGYIQTRWVDAELNEYGIYKDSKWESLRRKMELFAHDNYYLKIPIIRFLVAPGIYLWIYLFMAVWFIVSRQFRQLLPLGFVLGYYVTLILGPTVQLRYLYPLMIVLPFLLLYMINNRKRTRERANSSPSLSFCGEMISNSMEIR